MWSLEIRSAAHMGRVDTHRVSVAAVELTTFDERPQLCVESDWQTHHAALQSCLSCTPRGASRGNSDRQTFLMIVFEASKVSLVPLQLQACELAQVPKLQLTRRDALVPIQHEIPAQHSRCPSRMSLAAP